MNAGDTIVPGMVLDMKSKVAPMDFALETKRTQYVFSHCSLNVLDVL